MYWRLIHSTLIALVIFGTSAAGAPPAMRRWTDRTGRFSTDAELVEIKQDSVVLKKADGSTVTVPLARLSDADRAYLKTLPKPDAKSSRERARPNLAFPDALTEPPPWHDANTPFDLAAFLKAPLPEENAAPLYLEAFYEFAPSEMEDLLFPDLTQEERKKRRDTFRPISQEEVRLHEAWEKDPQSVDPAAVDAWLANYDVGFEKLAAAQQRRTCMFQPGRSVHSLWPHIGASRAVGRAVEWRTRRDLQGGELERPLEDLNRMLRLSRDLQVRGGAVAQVVAVALNEQCCKRVPTILNAPGIDARHCDRLLGLLTDHEAKGINAFVEGNRADYISSRQALHDLQHRSGSFDPKVMRDEWALDGDVTSPLACINLFADLGDSKSERLTQAAARLGGRLLPSAWQGGKMLSDEEYAKEVAALNRFFATILSLAEQPNFGRKEIEAAEAPINETALATFVIPSESGLIQVIRRSDARLRGTQCLVALRRWQLEHAQPPPDIATLVKSAGMAGVPIDSYSGEPLRMAVIDGKPVIYSVGPDGQDDQAKIEWSENMPRQPGDFIFRLQTASQ